MTIETKTRENVKKEEGFIQSISTNLTLFFIFLLSAGFPAFVWVNPLQHVSPVVLGIICLILIYIFRGLLKRAVYVHKNIERNRDENSFGKKITLFYFVVGGINFIFYLYYLSSKPEVSVNSLIQVLTLILMGLIAYRVLKKRTPKKAEAEIITSTDTAA